MQLHSYIVSLVCLSFTIKQVWSNILLFQWSAQHSSPFVVLFHSQTLKKNISYSFFSFFYSVAESLFSSFPSFCRGIDVLCVSLQCFHVAVSTDFLALGAEIICWIETSVFSANMIHPISSEWPSPLSAVLSASFLLFILLLWSSSQLSPAVRCQKSECEEKSSVSSLGSH